MHDHINQEFTLGDGTIGIGEGEDRIDLPDPRLCNLKLNVTVQAMHVSGAAGILEEQQNDFDRASIQPFVLGTSTEMDNMFFNKPHIIRCRLFYREALTRH
jgi:hypothetical protein